MRRWRVSVRLWWSTETKPSFWRDSETEVDVYADTKRDALMVAEYKALARRFAPIGITAEAGVVAELPDDEDAPAEAGAE